MSIANIANHTATESEVNDIKIKLADVRPNSNSTAIKTKSANNIDDNNNTKATVF